MPSIEMSVLFTEILMRFYFLRLGLCFPLHVYCIVGSASCIACKCVLSTNVILWWKVSSEAVLLAAEAARHLQDSVPWDHLSTCWSFWQCLHWAQKQRISWDALTQVHLCLFLFVMYDNNNNNNNNMKAKIFRKIGMPEWVNMLCLKQWSIM